MKLRYLLLSLLTALFAQSVYSQNKLQYAVWQIRSDLPKPEIQNELPKGNALRPGIFNFSDSISEVYNPIGKTFAGTKDGKLYTRKKGEANLNFTDHMPLSDWYWDVEGAMWSPDGKFLTVKQINDTEVPLIELQLGDGTFYKKPYTRAGEPLPKHQYYVLNFDIDAIYKIDHGLEDPYIHSVGWSKDSNTMRFVRSDRLMKTVDVLEYNVPEDTTRTLFTEASDTYMIGLELLHGYDTQFKERQQIIFQDSTFIWQSERSGYNQLYLYDLDGLLIRPLTSLEDNGIVYKVHFTDANYVYYNASGSIDKVYEEHIFRASLDSPNVEKIVEGPLIYVQGTSADKDSLWIRRFKDYRLSVELYTPSGKMINTLEEADLSFTKKEGFDPEYTSVTPPDGKNPMPVLILKPKGFDPDKTYPLIEYIYAGSPTINIPRQPWNLLWLLQDLSNLGYIIIVSDTRGTPGQGKTYQDYSYGRMGQVEIADHAYILEHLAKTRPFMDLERVGIWGVSWGGFYALRALVERPDLYKAGFIGAPSTDLSTMRVPVEVYMGCLPQDCPEKYKAGDITPKLSNLNAPLFIVHGTNDADVPIEESKRLVEKLKSINKDNVTFVPADGINHFVNGFFMYYPSLINFFYTHLKK